MPKLTGLLAAALLLHTACEGTKSTTLPDSGLAPDAGDAGSEASGLPTKAQIDDLVAPIVDGGWSAGFVIGLLDPTGQEVFGYGETSDGSGVTPDEHTLFEIGSITKTFNSLWLATLEASGTAQAHDQVQSYLPSGFAIPTYNGQAIELWHLDTHTSGLLRDADYTDALDPFSNITVPVFENLLATTALMTPPGDVYSYSNVGVGLLGYALSQKAGIPWQQGVTSAVIQPLGLIDTAEILSPDQQSRFEQPHDWDLNVVHPYTFTPAMEAAGSLRSTASDLLQVGAAEVALRHTSIDGPMAATHTLLFPANGEGQCGGLFLDDQGNYYHDGQTGGFSAFFMFNPGDQRVVVILSTDFAYIQPLAYAALGLARGEAAPAIVPNTLVLPAATLDEYVGTYAFQPGFNLTITRAGAQVYVQGTGQAAFKLYAEQADSFYMREVYAQGIFNRDDSGKVVSLAWTQNGNTTVAPKK